MAGLGIGDVVAEKYRIDRVLGVGGMGIVFLARHLQLDGPVALKFLSAECLANQQAIGRFRREAQAAVKLRNEHVVRVFDVGTHTNGLPYIVMEYLDGVDLAELLASSGPLPPDRAADLLIQTCEALSDAHGKGIVHRDLKPSNLFCLPRGDGGVNVKVVDFGISKVTEAMASFEQGLTTTGNIMGSPSYMSPEQMKTPNRVDHRTDLWSLGVVLYESLTGQFPFPASTYAEICLYVHQDPPVPPRTHRPELPEALQAVILKCLEKDPDQRYASAADLAAALAPFAPGPGRSLAPWTPALRPQLSSDAKAPSTPPRSPSGHQTLTVAAPNWEQSTDARAARKRRSRLLVPAALLLGSAVVAGGLLLGRVSSPTPGVNAVPTTGSPRPDALAPSKAREPGAETASPAAEPLGSARGVIEAPAPTDPAPTTAPAATVAHAAPAPHPATGARPPATKPAAAAVPSPATSGAAPRPAASSSKTPVTSNMGASKPRTERDPKSSTWTR